jgi:hypothetical protein
VLNWEQPPADPNTTSAAISHLREYIRTRSPRVIHARRRADENPVRTIRVLRKPATYEKMGADIRRACFTVQLAAAMTPPLLENPAKPACF